MRKDIFGGLKNALERGDDLEKAVRSFITAGYQETEVREAAQALSSGTPIKQTPGTMPKKSKMAWPVQKKQQAQLQQQKIQPLPQQMQTQSYPTTQPPMQPPIQPSQQMQQQQAQQLKMPKTRKKMDWKLIILGSALFILIIVLLSSILFKDAITSFFSGFL